jgi:hypothetical protein
MTRTNIGIRIIVNLKCNGLFNPFFVIIRLKFLFVNSIRIKKKLYFYNRNKNE